jgi:hypothetical protein
MLSIYESYTLSKCSLVSLQSCLTPILGGEKQVKNLRTVHFGLKTQNEQGFKVVLAGKHTLKQALSHKQNLAKYHGLIF